MVARILDIVGQTALFTVEPDIGHHPVSGGHCAGGQRYMTHDGLGIGVLVMSISVFDTLLHQITKPAFTEHVDIASRQITTQGVNGDLQDQPRGGASGSEAHCGPQ